MLLVPDDATPEWTFEKRNRGSCSWGGPSARAVSGQHGNGREVSPLNTAILSMMLRANANDGTPSATARLWGLDPALLAELCEAYFAVADFDSGAELQRFPYLLPEPTTATDFGFFGMEPSIIWTPDGRTMLAQTGLADYHTVRAFSFTPR